MTKIYRKETAVRFARFEAVSMPKDQSVLVLLRPSGSCVGVYDAGTGRASPPRVARRARKVVHELMPELFPRRKRRTSRAATGRTRSRRTSRRSEPAVSNGRSRKRSAR